MTAFAPWAGAVAVPITLELGSKTVNASCRLDVVGVPTKVSVSPAFRRERSGNRRRSG